MLLRIRRSPPQFKKLEKKKEEAGKVLIDSGREESTLNIRDLAVSQRNRSSLHGDTGPAPALPLRAMLCSSSGLPLCLLSFLSSCRSPHPCIDIQRPSSLRSERPGIKPRLYRLPAVHPWISYFTFQSLRSSSVNIPA